LSFQIKNNNNIEYGTFTEFDDHRILTAVSFRKGGISSSSYHSLNMGLHTNDKNKDVLRNRELFFKAINVNYADIVTLKQVHSKKVENIQAKDKGKGALKYEDSFKEADGMVTDVPGLPLVVFTADCLSIFFADPVARIIGIAHSGWKGTLFNIAGVMVDRMVQKGASVKNIIVGSGPAIGSCCYHVGEDLYRKFNHKYIEIRNKKYYLNLNEVNTDNLVEAGIKKDNIFHSNICTSCRHDLCFSYRMEKETGRMASCIMLWE